MSVLRLSEGLYNNFVGPYKLASSAASALGTRTSYIVEVLCRILRLSEGLYDNFIGPYNICLRDNIAIKTCFTN